MSLNPPAGPSALQRVPLDWPHRVHSRSLRVGLLDWHVQCAGQGPTLLLLHGSGASAHSWAGMLPALARHATVVAPDLPGHGYTEGASVDSLSLPKVAQALQALLLALDLPAPSLVVGHSAGAALGLRWVMSQALRPPDALLGFNPSLIAPPAVYTRLLGPLITPLATSGPVASLLARWSARSGMVGRLLDSTGSRLAAPQRAPYEQLFSRAAHVRGAMGFMAAADLEAVLAAAAGLRTACHFVLGARDAWVPEQPLRRVIQRALPGAGVETWAGGHLLHEVEPERAAAWVLQHLPEVPNRA